MADRLSCRSGVNESENVSRPHLPDRPFRAKHYGSGYPTPRSLTWSRRGPLHRGNRTVFRVQISPRTSWFPSSDSPGLRSYPTPGSRQIPEKTLDDASLMFWYVWSTGPEIVVKQKERGRSLHG